MEQHRQKNTKRPILDKNAAINGIPTAYMYYILLQKHNSLGSMFQTETVLDVFLQLVIFGFTFTL